MSIVPFTWLVMLPTNSVLFGLNALPGGAEDLDQVLGLLAKWKFLHILRSLLPLTGAILGLSGTLQEKST